LTCCLSVLCKIFLWWYKECMSSTPSIHIPILPTFQVVIYYFTFFSPPRKTSSSPVPTFALPFTRSRAKKPNRVVLFSAFILFTLSTLNTPQIPQTPNQKAFLKWRFTCMFIMKFGVVFVLVRMLWCVDYESYLWTEMRAM